jgi:hypothetical protein
VIGREAVIFSHNKRARAWKRMPSWGDVFGCMQDIYTPYTVGAIEYRWNAARHRERERGEELNRTSTPQQYVHIHREVPHGIDLGHGLQQHGHLVYIYIYIKL